ncbi:dihydrofolate reductase [Coxiella endosymbiont of Amblyomma americanum]|uniref:dihydrofolate reductase n=1 Tax=Coxiella endosymbiont of Amblyomma americanum TaxID=325775 RepID=UPI002110D7C4|nr:dihydrofolate reductase [Coxiella endosymbiont of Amblyomma americanum]
MTLVAAMDKNRVIGYKNRLPWHLPADLVRFKSVTLQRPVVMGRKTFESIGKPMSLRRNIVITQQKNMFIKNCEIFHSFNEAIDALKSESEIMVIGGGQLFKEALPKANKMILTIIEYSFRGDVYFPFWKDKEWYILSKEDYKKNENNFYSFSFLELKRYARNQNTI